MKFGKQLECLSLSKFEGYYIQYRELKKAIKVLAGHEKNQSTVQEVTHWTSSFLRCGPNPEVPPEARLQDVLSRELERVSKYTELEEDALHTQLDRLEQDTKKNEMEHAELMQELNEIGDQIVQLKVFTRLNFTGFRKILKKYDKWTKSKVMPWFMAQVARAKLMTVDYDRLLQRLNDCAVVLRKRAVKLNSPSEGGGRKRVFSMGQNEGGFSRKRAASSMQQSLHDSKDLIFFIDSQDSMQVKVQLAKYLDIPRGSGPAAGAAARNPTTGSAPAGASAALRSRTVSVFFDTDDFAVYQAHHLGVPAGDFDLGGGESHIPKRGLLHLRHTAVGAVCLVHEDPEKVLRSEVSLARASVSRFCAGQPVQPSGITAASSEMARATLSSAQSALREDGLHPVAQASYFRSRFGDDGGSLVVTLDEDVRLARAAEWDGQPKGSEVFPFDILHISLSGAASFEVPDWLLQMSNRGNLSQVSGFSKAAHAIARFYGRSSNLHLPHWYRQAMNYEAPGGDQSEEEEVSSKKVVPDEVKGKKVAVVADAVLPGEAPPAVRERLASTMYQSAASHLLHEFGTPGEGSSPQVPASSGDLSAPLLAPASGVPQRSPKPPSLFQRLWRGRRSSEEKSVSAMPVRRAIVAVQPKTLLSNERTFLEWIHFATLFATIGVALLHGASEPHQVNVARSLILLALLVVLWSLQTFNWRAEALDKKASIEYHDSFGPPLLIGGLLMAMLYASLGAVGVLDVGSSGRLR
mmetsp:Transcript_5553/g.12609  ORF Transcript_5553/g.12609 Transcript_5553/m.12609 type:complete len:749 (+) Transcript_5553:50-2296(+)